MSGALDSQLIDALRRTRTITQRGRVVQAFGTLLRASGVHARIGQQCRVIDRDGGGRDEQAVMAEVVGFSDGHALLVPLSPLQGMALDAEVEVLESSSEIAFGDGLLGRVIDCFGRPLDGRPLPPLPGRCPVHAEAPNPLERQPVDRALATGVRAIDALLTVGRGQRVGVFAMAGGGKSTLLGMLARQAGARAGSASGTAVGTASGIAAGDRVNVVALIGERGREVREFLDDSLGPAGLARSVVVVSTSDRPAMERARAAYAATAIAEGFRARGADVVLMMDSVTRFARALREIGLAIGEPAVRRGFPPSGFAELPRLFERAGNDAHGSITGFYTVLVEDEDGSDPVGEEVRSILDGHLVLSRRLAQASHYPAIDALASASRVFSRVAAREHQQAAGKARALMARHAEIEFLLRVGEYKPGSDVLADEAIAKQAAIRALLCQPPDESSPFDEAMRRLQEVAA
ncbi:MAG: FliI/YscN family ATPase [Burkholderiaceae bacterium]